MVLYFVSTLKNIKIQGLNLNSCISSGFPRPGNYTSKFQDFREVWDYNTDIMHDKISHHKNIITITQMSWDIFLLIRHLRQTVEGCPRRHPALCMDVVHLQVCNTNKDFQHHSWIKPVRYLSE